MVTNDNTNLESKTSFDSQLLQFDFPGLKIGVAEYEEGPTGCTVFYFPDGASTAIDVRGGSVGTIGNYEWNHAICLAGGSLYGLEAATGVAAELFARRNYSTNFEDIALVSGAIIYDYPPRENAIYPDKRLGRAAIKAAVAGVFPMGRHGVGCSASVGKAPFRLADLTSLRPESIDQLEKGTGFYHLAASLIDYIVATYGREQIPLLIQGLHDYTSWDELAPAVLDMSVEALEAGWNQWLVTAYDLSPEPASPTCPSSLARITSPEPGAVVKGQVAIQGTAVSVGGNSYELAYASGRDADEGFHSFDGGFGMVGNDQLGVFDSTSVSNGIYTLRLTSVARNGNPLPVCRMTITIQN